MGDTNNLHKTRHSTRATNSIISSIENNLSKHNIEYAARKHTHAQVNTMIIVTHPRNVAIIIIFTLSIILYAFIIYSENL